MKLNLETNSHVDEVLKVYLEENASETLAEKINNGVPIEKEGKRLLNKKTLSDFLAYAAEEAKKQAEKGANSACVEDKVVFGWLIHYFEEDNIIGILYNEDGTEYVPPKPKVTTKAKTTPIVTVAKPVEPPKPKETQMSLFDSTFEEQGVMVKAENMSLNESEEPAPKVVTKTQNFAPVCENIEHTPWVLENYPEWYKRYLEIQSQHKNSLVLMRLGDFYEMFDDTATTAANILDLTLTSKRITDKERALLCGVPYHAVDVYIEKLLVKGYSVTLCESSGSNVRVFNPKVETIRQDSEYCYDEETDDYVDIYEQEQDLHEEIDRLSPDETEAYLNVSDDEIDEDGVVHNEEYRLLAEIAQILQINLILR